MGIFDNLLGNSIQHQDFLEAIYVDEYNPYNVPNPYFEIVPYIMANKLSSYEVLTYEKGELKKTKNWYIWNVRPNKLQNAQTVKQQIYFNLLRHGKAIIYRNNKQFFVVNPVGCDIKYLSGTSFVASDLFDMDNNLLAKKATEDEVMIMKYDLSGVRAGKLYSENVINALTAKLTKAEIDSLTRKYIMKIDATVGISKESRIQSQTNIKEGLKSGDDAVIPLDKSIVDFTPLQNPLDKRTNFSVSQETDKYLMIAERIAYDSYGYPHTNAENQDVDELREIALMPIARSFQEELNASLYTEKEILEGSRVSISIFGNDPKEQEVLIRSGINSINDARVELGKDPINEEWADKHWMTLNYNTIENVIEGLE